MPSPPPVPTPIADAATRVFGLELNQWTAIGVILTGLGVIVAAYLAWRGQRQDRLIATNSAERSEAAARLTEEYTGRIVEALEKIAREGLGVGGRPVPRVKWELAHHDGDRYRLTNIGEATALDVRVAADPSLSLIGVEGGPDLASTEALTFMASVSMGTKDTTITVRWRQEGSDDDLVWRYPLPGRPPRQ